MSRILVDSGIEWIGKFPCDWNLLQLRNATLEINEKNNPIKFSNILSLTNTLGVVPYEEKGNQGNISKEDVSQYKLAYKNTIIINSMNLKIGSVGLSAYDGCVSPVYYVLAGKAETDIRFINYIFQSDFQKYLGKYGKGILEIREKIPMYDVLHAYIPYPTRMEQIRIADYLDSKCSMIDKTIADNNKAIKLLEEYKKSRINDVVTLGLKDEVKLTETGIKYFKRIPSHWQVKKLKYIVDSFSKGNGITKDEVFDDGDIQCVRYGEIYSKYINSFIKSVSRTYVDRINSPKFISKGDILCAATGELVEEIGKNIVYLGDESCIVGGDIIIIKHSQDSRYLNYLLNSTLSQEQKSEGKAKLKVVHIYASEMGNIILPLPPINEQKEIADYLDKMCFNVDKVIEYRKQIIEKLEEYKKSLIYEVVTGKKEV